MRTMCILTALLLVSFLGKLSIAVEKEPISECGKTYACFVPRSCTTGDYTPALSTISTKEVDYNDPVTKDCPAIIRFHAFTPKWMYVSIESLGMEKSIIFKTKTDDGDMFAYECEVDANNEVKGGYRANGVIEGEMIDSKGNPLKCVFLVKKDTSVNKIHDSIQFIIGGRESEPTRKNTEFLHCDPSATFKFKPLENSLTNEKYAMVDFSPHRPGKYECKGNLFNRMEYKPEESDSYKEVTKLTCFGSTFELTVEGKKISSGSGFLHIRCAAKAHYFCDYEVKSVVPSGDSSVKVLEQKKADPTKPEKGEIKCPLSHPFIRINGNPMLADGKPVMNGEFKCLHQNGISQWMLNGIGLRKNAAEVHCSNQLKCQEIKKIPASSIKKGKLINDIPTCREGGAIKLEPTMTAVTEIFCNEKTGLYMYRTGNEDIEVGNATFKCEYPKKFDDKKNYENKMSAIKSGGFTTAGITIGLILLVVVGFCAFSWVRMYFIKKRLRKRDEAESNAYGAGFEKNTREGIETTRSSEQKDSKSKKDSFESTVRVHLSGRQIAKNTANGDAVKKFMTLPVIGAFGHFDEKDKDAFNNLPMRRPNINNSFKVNLGAEVSSIDGRYASLGMIKILDKEKEE